MANDAIRVVRSEESGSGNEREKGGGNDENDDVAQRVTSHTNREVELKLMLTQCRQRLYTLGAQWGDYLRLRLTELAEISRSNGDVADFELVVSLNNNRNGFKIVTIAIILYRRTSILIKP